MNTTSGYNILLILPAGTAGAVNSWIAKDYAGTFSASNNNLTISAPNGSQTRLVESTC